MNDENSLLQPKLSVFLMPFVLVLAIWFVYWFEFKFNFFFNAFGVAPKSLIGLRGIVFSPFIHGGIEHLYSNTIPLFLLTLALFYFYHQLAFKILLYGVLSSGFLTWLIGQEGTHHIGASGLIYVLASFLFFKGIWSKQYRLMALSLIVVFVYGSLVWGVLPGVPGISWEGHLSGFICGLLLAFIYKKETNVEVKKYAWEKDTYNQEEDEFMKHFDEKGNFIPSSKMPDEHLEEEDLSRTDMTEQQFKVTYHFKKKKE
jgi:membrane associated rhomboid family serine protease